jgi:hypothetical protein
MIPKLFQNVLNIHQIYCCCDTVTLLVRPDQGLGNVGESGQSLCAEFSIKVVGECPMLKNKSKLARGC